MRDIYDVAVVGAGPAGATFARELAARAPRLSLLLIDGQSENRKKPCGGLLAPDAQAGLAEQGLTLPREVLADPQIFTVETFDICRPLARSYRRHYLNMDRYRFDCYLLSLLPPSVERAEGRVGEIARIGALFEIKLGEQIFYSRALVGADGGGSLVRRLLYGKMPPRYVAIQEKYSSPRGNIPPYSCIFDSVTSDSCSWTINKDGYIIFGGAFEARGCRTAFEKQKQRFERLASISFGEPEQREACLACSPRKFTDFVCGGKGFYLVGEAGGFISASSFEGISSAMKTGKLLAEAFAEGRGEKGILKCYRKKTLPLRIKLTSKIVKRAILCSPLLRFLIMKSGICSVKTK